MDQFFWALITIMCGGILPLFLWRRFTLMKFMGSAGIALGSLWGLVEAISLLLRNGVQSASFTYLNTFSLTFSMDGFSAFFLVTILLICMLAAIYSFHYMHKQDQALRTAAGYLFFSLLTISMALVVTADNLITFLLAWEIMSLSSFFLVVYNFEEAENRQAGYLYFVFTQVGAMFILAAFGIIAAQTGSMSFEGAADLSDTLKILVFVLAFIGFGSKAGVFPFHAWLPHAHPAAPSHISAVMSGVMIKTGIYGIVRIYDILQWKTPLFGEIVLVAGMVSAVLGVVYAIGQHDLKRLLAYHSVENIGIILLGVGMGMMGVALGRPVMATLGFAGGLLHVLNHSIFKSLLFMGAGMVLHQTGTRTIDRLGGLIKNMKITGTTFVVGSMAICGLPPFNGFVSEFLVYFSGFKSLGQGGTAFVLGLLLIVSLAIVGGLALACFTKVIGVVFQGEPRSRAAAEATENGLMMYIPMIALSVLCIVIGVFPAPFVALVIKAVASLELGYGQIPMMPFIELTANITRGALLFFGLLAIGLLLRGFFYRGKTIGRSGTWGCGFTQPTVKMQYTGTSYGASILEFFKPVAPLHEDHPPIKGRFPTSTHYHSHIEDIAEKYTQPLIVRPILFMFDKLRWLQHGDIHLYIGYILLAIIVLLFFVK